MWSASPQISWMTTTAPRGVPVGSARYAVRSCSGRSIIVPMPHSYPLVPGRGCEDGVVPTQPAAVTRALAHVRGLSTGRPLDPTLRVTLNFHPDRLVRGEPVLAVMARGGAYDDAEPALRPKYGALDLHRSPYGAAPRFGSAHVRLAAHMLDRTTFCFPDSVFEPEHFGTAPAFALGEHAEAADHDLLDDYVEAHAHGVLDLARDVEALVLDPGYRGTDVEADALRLGVP